MTRRAVAVLVHRRAWAVEQTLAALARCDGIAGWEVIVLENEATREVQRAVMVHATPFASVHEMVPHPDDWSRERRVSAGMNALLQIAFDGRDLVLVLEDDVVLAPDALRFVEWAGDRYRDDPDVFTISTFNRRPAAENADPYGVVRAPGWGNPGWATWRDRWDEMRAGWGWADAPWVDGEGRDRLGKPWDCEIHDTIRRGRCHVYPLVSRSQHIGHVDGSPFTPRIEAAVFAGDLVLPPWSETSAA